MVFMSGVVKYARRLVEQHNPFGGTMRSPTLPKGSGVVSGSLVRETPGSILKKC